MSAIDVVTIVLSLRVRSAHTGTWHMEPSLERLARFELYLYLQGTLRYSYLTTLWFFSMIGVGSSALSLVGTGIKFLPC